jgi:monoamine oxidase
MHRRTFTRLSIASFLCAPHLALATAPQHVTVVGAGSAGLTAAYHLAKAGVEVQILEASTVWGGRIKRYSGFGDMPLDLGAEWIHDDPRVFGQMLGRKPSELGIQTIDYRPQTYKFWHNNRLNKFNALRNFYQEVKFLDTTWYGFFERFMLPTIAQKIVFGAEVTHIAEQGKRLSLRLKDGRSIDTDKVLVAVPLSVLKSGKISFSESLTPPNIAALEHVDFGSGFKAFLQFSERFYPDMLFEGPRSSILADTWAEKIYYDAVFGKPTRQNILGLFSVSEKPTRRSALKNADLVNDILSELNEIFGGIVKSSFSGAVVQN